MHTFDVLWHESHNADDRWVSYVDRLEARLHFITRSLRSDNGALVLEFGGPRNRDAHCSLNAVQKVKNNRTKIITENIQYAYMINGYDTGDRVR